MHIFFQLKEMRKCESTLGNLVVWVDSIAVDKLVETV